MISGSDANNDWWAVAAIGLMAMVLVTFDHEALGHGGMCLALGGRILELTSSIFRCNLRSAWIAPAGPLCNLIVGTLSLLLTQATARRQLGTRLFLILVTSFSYFWEAGYVIHAMHRRDGDLYFAGQDFLGEPALGWRITGALMGLMLYIFTVRWAWRALSELWPGNLGVARRAGRIVWLSATLGAALAALFYRGVGLADLRDAILEIGVSAFPLLWIGPYEHRLRDSRRLAAAKPTPQDPSGPPRIARNRCLIGAAALIYAVFFVTLGRGIFD
jgi:hypothetical protein